MLALVSITAAVLTAVPLSPPSKVEAVTVYQGVARVTRVARLDLPAGDVQVVLAGLPDGLQDDSIGVEGRGAAKAKVFGAVVQREVLESALAPEARSAQDKVRGIEDALRALDNRGHAAQARKAFSESVRASYQQERSANLATRGADPKEWSAMAEFVEREVAVALEELRKVELAKRPLEAQLLAARQALQLLGAKGQVAQKQVAVDLRVEKAGSFELQVSYQVPGALWTPVWDAHLEPSSGKMELSLSGTVVQHTGEDWEAVKLSLSTAQPTQPLYVPELEPLYLSPVGRTDRPTRAYAAPVAMEAMPSARAPQAEAEADALDAGATYQLEAPAARVSQGMLATTFESPRRESVDGGGKARKAFLAAFPLEAQVQRRTAPRVEPRAFLTAAATNTTGLLLLPGEVSVFLGGEYLGRTHLPQIAAGDEVKLAFGADPRIKVERRLVERKRETAGLFGGKDVVRYRFRTEITNHYSERRAVTLLEQLPVSRDQRIEVKVLDATSKTSVKEDPNRPGVRTYELTLEPKATKVIELVYEVHTPRGESVAGLE